MISDSPNQKGFKFKEKKLKLLGTWPSKKWKKWWWPSNYAQHLLNVQVKEIQKINEQFLELFSKEMDFNPKMDFKGRKSADQTVKFYCLEHTYNQSITDVVDRTKKTVG